MPTLRDLKNNPKFDALSSEAKAIVFHKLSSQDNGFQQLSPEAQSIVRSRLTGIQSQSVPSVPSTATQGAQQGVPADIQSFITDQQAGIPATQSTQAPPDVNMQNAITPPARQDISQQQKDLLAKSSGILGSTAKNIPASGAEFVGNLIEPIRHPIQTARNLKDLAVGTAELIIPGEQGKEKVARAVGRFYKKRYGSIENAVKTFNEDPVGFAADLSGFLSLGGGVISKVGKLSDIGNAIKNAGSVLDPLTAIPKVGAKALAGTVGKTSRSFAKTALKLRTDLGLERINVLAEKFLNSNLKVNEKTLNIFKRQTDAIRKEVNDIITNLTKEGKTIPRQRFLDAMDNLIVDRRRQGFGVPEVRLIERLKKEFIKQEEPFISIDKVQDIKKGMNRGFQQNINSTFNQVRKKVIEAKRNVAMESLNELSPQLKTLNADDSAIIELSKAIEKRVILLENKESVATPGLAAGGFAGGVASGNPQALAAGSAFAVTSIFITKILESPNVQLKLGRALAKAHSAALKSGITTPVTQSLFQQGRASEVINNVNPQQAQ